MKTINKILPLMIAALMLMVGCSRSYDFGGEHFVDVALSDHNLEMIETDVVDIDISVPSSSYVIESKNENIALGMVVGNDIIRLTALAQGQTLLRLKDDQNHRASILVNVFPLQELSLEPIPEGFTKWRVDNSTGEPKSVKILSGNGGYSAESSDLAFATAEIIEDQDSPTGYSVLVKGVANTDEVKITVTDKKGKSGELVFQVTNPVVPIELDKISFVGDIGDGPFTVNILNGSGTYSVSSSCSAVATAELADNIVTINLVGDGEAVISVVDPWGEKADIQVRGNFDLTDDTPRFYFNGIRYDENTPGVAIGWQRYVTNKRFIWYSNLVDGDYQTIYELTWPGVITDTSNIHRRFTITAEGKEQSYLAADDLLITRHAVSKDAGTPRTIWLEFTIGKDARMWGFIMMPYTMDSATNPGYVPHTFPINW